MFPSVLSSGKYCILLDDSKTNHFIRVGEKHEMYALFMLKMKIVPALLLTACCIAGISAGFLDFWFGSEPVQLIEKTYPPRFYLTPQSNATKPTTPPIAPKHELEDEYHKEETTPSTQEIDETQTAGVVCILKALNAKNGSTSTVSNEAESRKPGVIKNVVVKHKPITITSTITEVATKYATIFPFCLKFEQVSRVCDGTLVTVKPTLPVRNDFPQRSSSTYEVTENADVVLSIPTTVRRSPQTNYENVLSQSSDYDYEFESLQLLNDGKEIKIQHEATPELRADSSKTIKQSVKKFNFLHEHEYTIQSEIVSMTTTLTTTNTAQTATIVASNCIPRDTQIPLCTLESPTFPKLPQFPIKIYP